MDHNEAVRKFDHLMIRDADVPVRRSRQQHHVARMPLAHPVRAAQVQNHPTAP
jgi:hypothetical protein